MKIRREETAPIRQILFKSLAWLGTIDCKKNGMVIGKRIKPEWQNTELIKIVRRVEDGSKIIGFNHSTSDQNRRKNHE